MTVDYIACHDALERAHATVDASECHGVLCGLLCVTRQFPEERWLDQFLEPGNPESARCTKMLRSTRLETERQLDDQQFEFEPMLPDEEVSLMQRGAALARWCRGFLYGLAVGGLDDSVSTSGDLREVLTDLSEFTRLDVAELENGTNALESDYAELVEYVRVGVMLIHTELKTLREKPSPDTQLH
jgi:yecA family protein